MRTGHGPPDGAADALTWGPGASDQAVMSGYGAKRPPQLGHLGPDLGHHGVVLPMGQHPVDQVADGGHLRRDPCPGW